MLSGLLDAPTATLAVGGLTCLSTYLLGIKNGKAAFITAVHQAADQVIVRLQAENGRLSARLEKVEAGEAVCKQELAEVRARVGLPPMAPA